MKLGGHTLLIFLVITRAFIPASSTDYPSLSSDCECNQPCFKVQENAPSGTYVGHLDQVPALAAHNNTQSYQITMLRCPGSDESFKPSFVVNTTTGAIHTAEALDREQLREICSTGGSKVSCLEGNAGKGGFTAGINIDITDVNDNKPQFTHILSTNLSTFTIEVEERDQLNNTLFCSDQLIAQDKDGGENGTVSYSVVSSPADFRVYTSDNNNQVCVANLIKLDRETNSSVSFVIKAEDMGTPMNLCSELTVVLELTDINDNSPMFIDPLLNLTVPENSSDGSFIGQYIATDKDIGSNGKITYTLCSSGSVPFYLNSSNGMLYLNGELDADISPFFYLIKIIATDNGGTEMSSEVSVNITVENVNDNQPIFLSTGQNKIQPEGNVSGSITVVTVTDLDGPNLTGTITSGGNYATIVPNNNNQQFMLFILNYKVSELDYESVQYIVIEFTISDGGNPEFTTSSFVTITVTDVNDNAPYLNKTSFEVYEEEIPPGSFLPFSLRDYFIDIDSSKNGSNKPGGFVAELNPDIDKLIEVNQTEGTLKVKNFLDREAIKNGMIAFNVKIYDQGYPQLNSEETIEIVLLDINDNEPEFEIRENQTFHVFENQPSYQGFGQVRATDKDEGLNAIISYRLVNSKYFTIDNVTGNLSSTAELDREEKSFYTLTVIAEDMGTPPLTSEVQIKVVVNDLNDNPPEFVNATTIFNVSATSPIGTTIGQMNVVDKDMGINAEVDFKVNNTIFFNISHEGTIFTMRELDFVDDTQEFQLLVTVFNTNNANMNSNISLQIYVMPSHHTSANGSQNLLTYMTIFSVSFFLLVIILILIGCIWWMVYYQNRLQSKKFDLMHERTVKPVRLDQHKSNSIAMHNYT